MNPRQRLVGNTNEKEPLFGDDVFTIMQLKNELPLGDVPTYGIPQNACFLE